MAENNPNLPTGGVPPKPGEAAKVQPKKETVRISLPPKPSATIKLPTVAAGGGPSGVTPPPPSAGASGKVAAPPPTAAPARPPTAAPGQRPAPAAPAPAVRPAPAPAAVRRVSGLDTGLAIAAAVIGLGAAVSLFMVLQLK